MLDGRVGSGRTVQTDEGVFRGKGMGGHQKRKETDTGVKGACCV